MQLRRIAIPLCSLLLTAVACSDDGSPATDTAATDTVAPNDTVAPTTPPVTVDPAEAATAYTEPGPYPVGVTTLQLADATKVEVWYPAVAGTTGTETYDVRDFTPDALKALLVADVPATFSYPAGRDAEVADGSFPVVLFSHGAIGFRLQSTFLTSHLASWGMIVAAPDHAVRDLPHLLDRLDSEAPRPTDTSTDQLLATLDLVLQEGTTPTSRFSDKVDGDHVATLGHSAGGVTAVRAAGEDSRIDGYVSMASGVFGSGSGSGSGGSTTSAGATTTVPPTTTALVFPGVPSFYLAGSEDHVADPAKVTTAAFDAAPAPSLLWIIDGAGHLAFSDLCTLGNGLGIIGVAEANGLGDFLDSAPGVRRLGSDGCEPPALPVADTFPIIDHAVTSWLLHLFGADAEPVGLGPDVADQYTTPVSITEK